MKDSMLLMDNADSSTANNPQPHSIKMMVILFVLFIFVVSDIFTNNVLIHFGKNTVSGRSPTNWGIAVQGITLVILFSLSKYLNDISIL